MYVIFFVLWIIFNGRITTEIVIFGLVIAAAVYAFICKFMDYSPKAELRLIKKIPYILQFFYYLVKEIVKANFATMGHVTTADYVIEPALIQFDTKLKTEGAKFLLANAITLTPGTITVAIEGDKFTVHCLDKSMADGIESSIFVQLLEKIEA